MSEPRSWRWPSRIVGAALLHGLLVAVAPGCGPWATEEAEPEAVCGPDAGFTTAEPVGTLPAGSVCSRSVREPDQNQLCRPPGACEPLGDNTWAMCTLPCTSAQDCLGEERCTDVGARRLCLSRCDDSSGCFLERACYHVSGEARGVCYDDDYRGGELSPAALPLLRWMAIDGVRLQPGVPTGLHLSLVNGGAGALRARATLVSEDPRLTVEESSAPLSLRPFHGGRATDELSQRVALMNTRVLVEPGADLTLGPYRLALQVEAEFPSAHWSIPVTLRSLPSSLSLQLEAIAVPRVWSDAPGQPGWDISVAARPVGYGRLQPVVEVELPEGLTPHALPPELALTLPAVVGGYSSEVPKPVPIARLAALGGLQDGQVMPVTVRDGTGWVLQQNVSLQIVR